jgi:hypothetical protein
VDFVKKKKVRKKSFSFFGFDEENIFFYFCVFLDFFGIFSPSLREGKCYQEISVFFAFCEVFLLKIGTSSNLTPKDNLFFLKSPIQGDGKNKKKEKEAGVLKGSNDRKMFEIYVLFCNY